MGNIISDPETAKSKEVFQVGDELEEKLEATKKELKNHVVAAMKAELQGHLKATKEELKKQSEKAMKDLEKVLEYKLENKELERKNTELSSEKAELEKQLEYARKAALVLMDAADAYQEATEKEIKAKTEELEDTRKAALVFMEAADTYQEEAERENKARTEDLENTRKAALVFMDAADTFEEAAEEQIKSKVEELEDMKMVFVDAADRWYQEAAEKQIKATVQTLEVLGGQEAMRVESLESEFSVTLANNQEMEVDATVKNRESEVEMEDTTKEPKDVKSKVEEIKAIKGLVMHENETLWLEDFIYEIEVESTEMQLNVLTEAKEEAATGFNVKEAKIMKELEELHAIRDAHQVGGLQC